MRYCPENIDQSLQSSDFAFHAPAGAIIIILNRAEFTRSTQYEYSNRAYNLLQKIDIPIMLRQTENCSGAKTQSLQSSDFAFHPPAGAIIIIQNRT